MVADTSVSSDSKQIDEDGGVFISHLIAAPRWIFFVGLLLFFVGIVGMIFWSLWFAASAVVSLPLLIFGAMTFQKPSLTEGPKEPDYKKEIADKWDKFAKGFPQFKLKPLVIFLGEPPIGSLRFLRCAGFMLHEADKADQRDSKEHYEAFYGTYKDLVYTFVFWRSPPPAHGADDKNLRHFAKHVRAYYQPKTSAQAVGVLVPFAGYSFGEPVNGETGSTADQAQASVHSTAISSKTTALALAASDAVAATNANQSNEAAEPLSQILQGRLRQLRVLGTELGIQIPTFLIFCSLAKNAGFRQLQSETSEPFGRLLGPIPVGISSYASRKVASSQLREFVCRELPTSGMKAFDINFQNVNMATFRFASRWHTVWKRYRSQILDLLLESRDSQQAKEATDARDYFAGLFFTAELTTKDTLAPVPGFVEGLVDQMLAVRHWTTWTREARDAADARRRVARRRNRLNWAVLLLLTFFHGMVGFAVWTIHR